MRCWRSALIWASARSRRRYALAWIFAHRRAWHLRTGSRSWQHFDQTSAGIRKYHDGTETSGRDHTGIMTRSRQKSLLGPAWGLSDPTASRLRAEQPRSGWAGRCVRPDAAMSRSMRCQNQSPAGGRAACRLTCSAWTISARCAERAQTRRPGRALCVQRRGALARLHEAQDGGVRPGWHRLKLNNLRRDRHSLYQTDPPAALLPLWPHLAPVHACAEPRQLAIRHAKPTLERAGGGPS